ncbi:hypothetical protein DYI95_002955 [Thermaerobacter sp. PB12/4term]|uniref:spore coat protein n=1 Tax=Thermaerobacter sp. PB12/4term TaxID=2293838 RepID=UPI000E327CC2|nr:spore coat protein [Thermaerobacter sp. PB12/4term]QIA26627.1 hypothetical protein DYI95_002955 [Thermaerobacter sp. PB12/4term]
MQRTVHEVLELRDLIVACDAVANKLLHAASTARDADVVQMLGAHQRTFRQQCQQLKQALAGEGGLYGLEAARDGGTGFAAPPTGPATAAFSPGAFGGDAGGAGGRGGPGMGDFGGPGSPGAGVGFGTGPGTAPFGAGPGTVRYGSAGPGAVPVRGPAGGPEPATRPVHPAEAGGAPGYPPTGPGTYSYRPAAATPDHRYRAGDPAGDGLRPIRGGSPELGPQGEGARATQQALRHRPELVGWEPGAGNNEGWQAGARREPAGLEARAGASGGGTATRAQGSVAPVAPGSVTAFDRPGAGRAEALDQAGYWRAGLAGAREPGVGGYGDVAGGGRMEAGFLGGQGPRRAAEAGGAERGGAGLRERGARASGAPEAEAFTAVRPVGYGPGAAAQVAGGPVPVAEAGPGFRGHWTAQGGPEGGPGTEGIRFDSPRVGFAPDWAPAPWSGPAAGSTPPAPAAPGTRPGQGPQQAVGYTAPPSAWMPEAAQQGPAQAAGVRLADPDALAVADCLQDCKHMAVRMMIAATEAADRHLRRTLYQMAGQHLEMAGQHYEWLRRRGLYTVPPAPADLIRHLEDDVRRTEEALKVAPAMNGATGDGALGTMGHGAPGGAVNTSLAGYPSGGLKGAFGGQQIRN